MGLKTTSICIFLLITSCCLAQEWKTYPYNPVGSQVSFSQDEGRHTSEPIEWWYTSGHLTGQTSGKTYSYMLTYFHYPASIFDGFRILNITDDDTGVFYQDTQPLDYTTLSTTKLDIVASLFFGATESWTNKLDTDSAPIPFEYEISAIASFGALNLEYETLKRPLILGDDGYLNQGASNYTYYYSQTSNEVLGTITLNGITENVVGTAWIDRQYGDFNPLNGEEYEWFSMQLSNGMDINLWNIFTVDNTIPNNDQYRILSSYVDEDTQYTASDFEIERLGFNWMPDNLQCYSKEWRLTSSTNNIDLVISSVHDNTEVQLPFRFFEGSTTISGTVNGVAVTGVGFAELLHSFEHPELSLVSPSAGVYDVSQPIVWELNNPDEGRPIFYDLEYSVDNQQSFVPIVQGLTDPSFLWDGVGLSQSDEIYFKIMAYSVDGVLNNTLITSSFTTSTLSSDDINELGISFYPNPVDDTLFLKLPESLSNVNSQLLDLNGKIVKDFGTGELLDKMDVNFLKSGIYFLSVESERGKSVLKFIKN